MADHIIASQRHRRTLRGVDSALAGSNTNFNFFGVPTTLPSVTQRARSDQFATVPSVKFAKRSHLIVPEEFKEPTHVSATPLPKTPLHLKPFFPPVESTPKRFVIPAAPPVPKRGVKDLHISRAFKRFLLENDAAIPSSIADVPALSNYDEERSFGQNPAPFVPRLDMLLSAQPKLTTYLSTRIPATPAEESNLSRASTRPPSPARFRARNASHSRSPSQARQGDAQSRKSSHSRNPSHSRSPSSHGASHSRRSSTLQSHSGHSRQASRSRLAPRQ